MGYELDNIWQYLDRSLAMKRTPKRILSYSLLFMFWFVLGTVQAQDTPCLLYTSPSPRDS